MLTDLNDEELDSYMALVKTINTQLCLGWKHLKVLDYYPAQRKCLDEVVRAFKEHSWRVVEQKCGEEHTLSFFPDLPKALDNKPDDMRTPV